MAKREFFHKGPLMKGGPTIGGTNMMGGQIFVLQKRRQLNRKFHGVLYQKHMKLS